MLLCWRKSFRTPPTPWLSLSRRIKTLTSLPWQSSKIGKKISPQHILRQRKKSMSNNENRCVNSSRKSSTNYLTSKIGTWSKVLNKRQIPWARLEEELRALYRKMRWWLPLNMATVRISSTLITLHLARQFSDRLTSSLSPLPRTPRIKWIPCGVVAVKVFQRLNRPCSRTSPS